jgi:hypothetical protein
LIGFDAFLEKGKRFLPIPGAHPMPTASPAVSSILQMAYTEAKRLASCTDPSIHQSPQVVRAIRLIWAVVKKHLPVQDQTTRDLDRLIDDITGGRQGAVEP